MAAYKAFNGTNEEPVFNAATQVLTNDKVDAFLSLPDSFGSNGLDYNLVRCTVLIQAGTRLAEWASQSQAEEDHVSQLLGNTLLMRDMLVAGGANRGRYGEAMSIYTQLLKASRYLGDEEQDATAWDDRSQKTILARLAVATAVELAVPVVGRFSHVATDPVARYLHFETAYKAGGLDPGFEVLTTFECRQVVNSDATDAEMMWLRQTMSNYRPEYIAINNSNPVARYMEAVHGDVSYGDPVVPPVS
jgi:hypothetical protein